MQTSLVSPLLIGCEEFGDVVPLDAPIYDSIQESYCIGRRKTATPVVTATRMIRKETVQPYRQEQNIFCAGG